MVAVPAISKGEHPCVWCGYPGEQLTREEWERRYEESKDVMNGMETEEAWMQYAVQKSNERRKELKLEPVVLSGSNE